MSSERCIRQSNQESQSNFGLDSRNSPKIPIVEVDLVHNLQKRAGSQKLTKEVDEKKIGVYKKVLWMKNMPRRQKRGQSSAKSSDIMDNFPPEWKL